MIIDYLDENLPQILLAVELLICVINFASLADKLSRPYITIKIIGIIIGTAVLVILSYLFWSYHYWLEHDTLFGTLFSRLLMIASLFFPVASILIVGRLQVREVWRKQEQTKCARLNEYSALAGKEKRIAILRYEQALKKAESEKPDPPAYHENADRLQKTGAVLRMEEPEIDGSVRIGVADGLGGPGMAVVEAFKIRDENEQIRARNAEKRASYDKLMKMHEQLDELETIERHRAAEEARRKAKQEVAQLEKEIDSTAYKRVWGNSDASKCFKCLRFSNTGVTVSPFKTGTVTVTTDATVVISNPKNRPPCLSRDTVIDGAVIAEIYDGEKMIGKANIPLPTYGIGENSTAQLTGMCLSCGKPDKNYTVKFTAGNLWIMDK